MASSTDNIRLGICSVTYKGVDLGYTKGGVNVDVTTATHPVTVDQFGESTVNEYITKREIKVTCPLAETTLDNLVAIMPGATLVSDGLASGTFTFTSTVPSDADAIVINGVTFTFKTTPVAATDVTIAATTALTLQNLLTKLTTSANALVNVANYSVTATTLVMKYGRSGAIGNDFTATKTTGTTITAPTTGKLTGGALATKARVDVTNSIGANLLKIAGALVLHPQERLASDTSDDLVIPLAATAGGMKFAYQFNAERIFNVDFMGFPDSTTKKLYSLGDLTAQ